MEAKSEYFKAQGFTRLDELRLQQHEVSPTWHLTMSDTMLKGHKRYTAMADKQWEIAYSFMHKRATTKNWLLRKYYNWRYLHAISENDRLRIIAAGMLLIAKNEFTLYYRLKKNINDAN